MEATTDKEGKFTLSDLAEGDYNLKFRSRDAKLAAVKSVTVTAGRTADVGKIVLKKR